MFYFFWLWVETGTEFSIQFQKIRPDCYPRRRFDHPNLYSDDIKII